MSFWRNFECQSCRGQRRNTEPLLLYSFRENDWYHPGETQKNTKLNVKILCLSLFGIWPKMEGKFSLIYISISSKQSAWNARDIGDMDLIRGSGRSPGRGHGSSLQYSCLENSIDRGAWETTAHGVTNSGT